MDIASYGLKFTAFSGSINKNVKNLMIAASTGSIEKTGAAIKVMLPNGNWSERTQIGMLGDVNNNGEITITDYTLVGLHITGDRTLTPAEFMRADINRDGVVNSTDRDLIQAYILS